MKELIGCNKWWKGMNELLGCYTLWKGMKELFANQVCEGDIQEITQHISDFFKSVCD